MTISLRCKECGETVCGHQPEFVDQNISAGAGASAGQSAAFTSATPLVVGAGQTGKSITVEATAVVNEDE